jgi:hypothetical protein
MDALYSNGFTTLASVNVDVSVDGVWDVIADIEVAPIDLTMASSVHRLSGRDTNKGKKELVGARQDCGGAKRTFSANQLPPCQKATLVR